MPDIEFPANVPTDVGFLVIGSGIAGLTYALETAKHGSTLILTKKDRAESNSNYAQGGIAGVMSDDDNVLLHKQDTLAAGAGLCHEDAVDVLVHEGPERIRHLMDLGARFTTERDKSGREVLALGREGGHSRNRIVHAVDRTGWECERTLLDAIRDSQNLQILEDYFVIDLAMIDGRCIGVRALDTGSGGIRLFRAKAVLLATGGCGQVYLHTTNPAIATGDGVAMAWRAGAPVANMEFIQFHPTSLYHPDGKSFLISEAVRGEGGILRTKDGSTFMERYDSRKELAPRDIVARAIHAERLKRGEPCVYLDVTHLAPDFLRSRFPTIHQRCREFGIDITRDWIPVVPAAHYQCGGVQTDLDGRTAIPGLFAAGEVSCTGVHGANRLASNSLLEAMVFGSRAAAVSDARNARPKLRKKHMFGGEYVRNPDPVSTPSVTALTARLRRTMNDRAGIVRNTSDLKEAEHEIEEILTACDHSRSALTQDADYHELRNMATVAWLIVRSALLRTESRGLHYTTDYPATDDARWRCDTVLRQMDA